MPVNNLTVCGNESALLASLHATLADELACPRIRLRLLWAYRRVLRQSHGDRPGTIPSFALLARKIEIESATLRTRAAIRDQRQPLLPTNSQRLVWLDGEALCVIPELAEDFQKPILCHMINNPSLHRQWLVFAGSRAGQLEVHRYRLSLGRGWARLRGRPWRSPELRRARLLFHLERHHVMVPQLLAFGQREKFGRSATAFMISEPVPGVIPLWYWYDSAELPQKLHLLRDLRVLARLHEAGCLSDSGKAIVISEAESSCLCGNCRYYQDCLCPTDSTKAKTAASGKTLARNPNALSSNRRVTDFTRLCESDSTDSGCEKTCSIHLTRGAMSTSITPARGWFWQRLRRGYRKIAQDPDWETFAGTGWSNRIMSAEVTDRYHAKQGRSIARWTVTGDNGQSCVVYLKRHYELPRRLGLLAALFPWKTWSTGLEEYEHLHWAASLGLLVPRAMAAGELVGPGGRLQSFLAVEELTGMVALHEAIPLAQKHLDALTFQPGNELAAEMARLAQLLHQRSVFHKDLYLCHFFIAESDCKQLPDSWTNRVYVIDLHRLARHSVTWLWWQVKDLAQLLYSSEITGVTIQDRLAFWRFYRAGMARSCGLLKRFVRLKWRMYRRHNLKRKSQMVIQNEHRALL